MRLPPPPPKARARTIAPAGQVGPPWLYNAALITFWGLGLAFVGLALVGNSLDKKNEAEKKRLGCWPKYGNKDCLGIL